MRHTTPLLLGALLLTASGVLASGEAPLTEEPAALQVREIVRAHDARRSDKREAGASDRVKVRPAEGEGSSCLAPRIVHIPDQEATDAE